MEHTFGQTKQYFMELCSAYHIPTHNKNILCNTLADYLHTDPNNPQIKDLLHLCICDEDNWLLSHFTHNISEKKEKKWNKTIKKKMVKLNKKLEENLFFQEKKKQLEIIQLTPVETQPRTTYSEELETLTHLFRTCFCISEPDSPFLYQNLQKIKFVIQSCSDLQCITPFIFYQTMLYHATELAQNPNYTFSTPSIWKFKNYPLTKIDDNRYQQYTALGRLFRKLCKYYSDEEDVSIKLCRYLFYQSSNLSQWFREEEEYYIKHYLSPLQYFLEETPICYYEEDEPEQFDAYTLFSVDFDVDDIYMSQYDELWERNEQIIKNYITYENIDVLLLFMNSMYQNSENLKAVVVDIFNHCDQLQNLPEQVSKECIYIQIFETLCVQIDEAVTTKVRLLFP